MDPDRLRLMHRLIASFITLCMMGSGVVLNYVSGNSSLIGTPITIISFILTLDIYVRNWRDDEYTL